MSFTLRAPTDADFPAIAELRYRAFGRGGLFVDALYPEYWTESGMAAHAARMQREFHTDPTARVIIAVDTEKQADPAAAPLVAAAVWKVYAGRGVDPGMLANCDEWLRPDEELKRFIIENYYNKMRRDAIMASKSDRVWVLDVLATNPDYQRRGAGRQIVEWGLQQADAEHAEAWLEGSKAGTKLYESCGFVAQEQYTLDLPRAEWGESPKEGPLKMRRAAR